MAQLDAREIIDFISNAKKKTPVKVTLKGDLTKLDVPKGVRAFVETKTGTVFGDWADVKPFLENNKAVIEDYEVENDGRNSAVPFVGH